jgi:opacity protein-like surface antigen
MCVIKIQKLVLITLITLSASVCAQDKIDWTGFYGSAMIGRLWGDVSEGDAYVTGYTGGYENAYKLTGGSSPDIRGTSLNFKLGFNKQIDTNLIGVELGGTLQTANSKNGIQNTYWTSTFYEPNTGNDGPQDMPNTVQTRIQNYGTLSGRIGHIFNETTLVYLKGGLAHGEIKRTITEPAENYFDSGTSIQDKRTELGYLLGVGGEHKINDKWSLRADYEYIDFGNSNFNYNGKYYGMNINQTQSNSIHFSNLSAGVSYAF